MEIRVSGAWSVVASHTTFKTRGIRYPGKLAQQLCFTEGTRIRAWLYYYILGNLDMKQPPGTRVLCNDPSVFVLRIREEDLRVLIVECCHIVLVEEGSALRPLERT
jgi:hypothetical protein